VATVLLDKVTQVVLLQVVVILHLDPVAAAEQEVQVAQVALMEWADKADWA
jgi:hypothetical protein